MTQQQLNEQLPSIVDNLVASLGGEPGLAHLNRVYLPSKETIIEAIKRLRQLVFPGYFGEQGLTPSHWEPAHAAAYVVNGIVICTWVPFVEELTYRGLGYTLLEPFGRWTAIVAVGLLFGLAHGLVLSLPVIAAFGCVLAWLRSETDSVFPGMVLHGLFNLVALVAAVTVGG